ncbi:hypothetical protein [Tritonibacter litoralis]|nr:hypothetical protein [Tritonibacter litoralis]
MIIFRLLRLVILLAASFVAGILFERYHQRETCAQNGGQWASGYCVGK